MDRSAEFQDGQERAQRPQFQTVQSQHNANFHALSVLDLPSALPTQNGLGSADLQRKMMGVQDSASGRSESTYDQRLWMRQPENPRFRAERGERDGA
jgi:hypothetical protein